MTTAAAQTVVEPSDSELMAKIEREVAEETARLLREQEEAMAAASALTSSSLINDNNGNPFASPQPVAATSSTTSSSTAATAAMLDASQCVDPSNGRSPGRSHHVRAFSSIASINALQLDAEAAGVAITLSRLAIDCDDDANEADIVASPDLTTAVKRSRLTRRLIRASSSGAVEVVRGILAVAGKSFVDVNGRDNDDSDKDGMNSTALIYAASFGYEDIVELLLKSGADVDAQDKTGWTALMWATNNNHHNVARLLLENGASPAKKTTTGRTVMDIVSHSAAADRRRWSTVATSNNNTNNSYNTTTAAAAINANNGLENIDGAHEHQRLFELLVSSTSKSQHSIGNGNFSGLGVVTEEESLSENTLTPLNGVDSLLSASDTNANKADSGRAITPPNAIPISLPGSISRVPTSDPLGVIVQHHPATLSLSSSSSSSSVSATTSAAAAGAVPNGLINEPDIEASDPDFNWSACEPDQMFVLSQADLPRVIQAAVTDIDAPSKLRSSVTREERYAPASLLFLGARFAFHYGGDELMMDLLGRALDSIRSIVTNSSKNLIGLTGQQYQYQLCTLAFWMTNELTLLYFLKRDKTLVAATVDAQIQLFELIHSTFRTFIRTVQAQIDSLLDNSFLFHDAMPDLFIGVKFQLPLKLKRENTTISSPTVANTKRRSFFFFGGGGGSSSTEPIMSPTNATINGTSMDESDYIAALNSGLKSPRASSSSVSISVAHASAAIAVTGVKAITNLISNAMSLLEIADIPPSICGSFSSHAFYYVASASFNRILATSDLLSRSRAVQLRMNITQLEDWARTKGLPTHQTSSHLEPLIQLIQLLQCVSATKDVSSLLDVLSRFDALNPLHIRAVLDGYRYEVGEDKVPNEVVTFIKAVAEEVEERHRRAGVQPPPTAGLSRAPTNSSVVRFSSESYGATPAHGPTPSSAVVSQRSPAFGPVGGSNDVTPAFPAVLGRRWSAMPTIMTSNSNGGAASADGRARPVSSMQNTPIIGGLPGLPPSAHQHGPLTGRRPDMVQMIHTTGIQNDTDVAVSPLPTQLHFPPGVLTNSAAPVTAETSHSASGSGSHTSPASSIHSTSSRQSTSNISAPSNIVLMSAARARRLPIPPTVGVDGSRSSSSGGGGRQSSAASTPALVAASVAPSKPALTLTGVLTRFVVTCGVGPEDMHLKMDTGTILPPAVPGPIEMLAFWQSERISAGRNPAHLSGNGTADFDGPLATSPSTTAVIATGIVPSIPEAILARLNSLAEDAADSKQ